MTGSVVVDRDANTAILHELLQAVEGLRVRVRVSGEVADPGAIREVEDATVRLVILREVIDPVRGHPDLEPARLALHFRNRVVRSIEREMGAEELDLMDAEVMDRRERIIDLQVPERVALDPHREPAILALRAGNALREEAPQVEQCRTGDSGARDQEVSSRFLAHRSWVSLSGIRSTFHQSNDSMVGGDGLPRQRPSAPVLVLVRSVQTRRLRSRERLPDS